MFPALARLLLPFATLLLLGLAGSPTASATSPFPMIETFQGATVPSDWHIGGDAALTGASGGVDDGGLGWLRLTPALNGKFGYAFNDQAFDSSLGLVANFDYAMWGGVGFADGLSFFLFDGVTTAGSFVPGALGAGLGYASCPTSMTPGVSNAYAGVGLDSWGNFTNPSTCGLTGLSAGLHPNLIAVRGGAPGYSYITSAGVLSGKSLVTTRPNAQHVTVTLMPDGKMSVYLRYADGTLQTVMSGVQMPTAPGTLKLGFGGATGGYNNNHEIRNVKMQIPADLEVAISDGAAGTTRPALGQTFTATVTNNGPNAVTGADVDLLPGADAANLSWTCAASGGASCGSASGTATSTNADLPVNGTATYTIHADFDADSVRARMGIEAYPDDVGETAEAAPGDNVATDDTDMTPANTVVPTATLAGNGTASKATSGTWVGDNLTFTQNWQRCEPGPANCVDIGGATGDDYAVQEADKGSTVRLRVRATNSAGAVDAYSEPFPLPDTTLTETPATAVASGSAQFSFATVTAGATFECAVDGAAFAACTSPHTATGLADGAHTFRVRAVAGGLADPTPDSFTWTVDRTTTVTIDEPVAGPANGPRPPVRGAGEPGATVVVTDGGTVLGGGVVDGSGRYAVDPEAEMAPGPHTLTATATDALGNTAAASVEIVVPAPPLSPVPTTATPRIAPTAVADGSSSVRVRCLIDVGPMSACTVRIYATARGRRVLVGTGTTPATASGTQSAALTVRFTRAGRVLLRRTPDGLRVRLAASARTPAGQAVHGESAALLFPQTTRLLPVIAPFRAGSAALTPHARATLVRLARQLRNARAITCVGNTDGRGDYRVNLVLGARRARTVCSTLRRLGVTARLRIVTEGEDRLRTSDRTPRGRSVNRRVELRVRYR